MVNVRKALNTMALGTKKTSRGLLPDINIMGFNQVS